MKFRCLLLLPVLMLSSCATIFNHKRYAMNICALQPNSTLVVYDSVYQLPARIKVKRSVEDLHITLKTDSIEKVFTLKASPSRTTVFANLPYAYMAPVAYAIDHYSGKRYYYGQNIVLDANDSVTVLNKGFFPTFKHRIYDFFQRPYPARKGQINLILAGPLWNNLYLDNAYGAKDYNFLGGFKVGLEYFYTDNSFVSFTASHVRGIVFKGSEDGADDGYVDPYSTSFELKNNYGYKRFTYGYGLNYSVNDLIVSREYPGRMSQSQQSKNIESHYHDYTFGLAVSSHFRLTPQLYFGVNYRPSLLLLKTTCSTFHYEHLISLEFLVKLRIKK